MLAYAHFPSSREIRRRSSSYLLSFFFPPNPFRCRGAPAHIQRFRCRGAPARSPVPLPRCARARSPVPLRSTSAQLTRSVAAVLPRTLTGSVAGCGTPRDHPSCVDRTCSCFLYRAATSLLCSRVCWNPDEGPLFKLTVVAPLVTVGAPIPPPLVSRGPRSQKPRIHATSSRSSSRPGDSFWYAAR
jgi:hypothetical protein